MKIVHVCSYFNTSKLYKYLFEELSKEDLAQEVFIPLYRNKEIFPAEYGTVREKEKSTKNIKYHYIECLSGIERYFLLHRTYKLHRNLAKYVRIDKDTILHAHSLFANGGICYFTKIKEKCEYITAFRATDLYVYKKLFFYRPFAKKIIDGANTLVFVSHSLKNNFLNVVKDKGLKEIIKKKGVVIPNGIPDIWFEDNIRKKEGLNENRIRFLYQGTLHRRKKVDYIIKIVEKLNSIGINAELEIVGGGPERENILNQIQLSEYRDKINLKSWTNNFKEILKNYQSSDIFIMPSENETFGIAYLEAMAVGLPIIYRKNDGIDGFFNNIKVGAAISGYDLESDIEEIKKVIDNYEVISQNTKEVVPKFRWAKISKDYMKIYKKLFI